MYYRTANKFANTSTSAPVDQDSSCKNQQDLDTLVVTVCCEMLLASVREVTFGATVRDMGRFSVSRIGARHDTRNEHRAGYILQLFVTEGRREVRATSKWSAIWIVAYKYRVTRHQK